MLPKEAFPLLLTGMSSVTSHAQAAVALETRTNWRRICSSQASGFPTELIDAHLSPLRSPHLVALETTARQDSQYQSEHPLLVQRQRGRNCRWDAGVLLMRCGKRDGHMGSRTPVPGCSIGLAVFPGNRQDTNSPCFANLGYFPETRSQTTWHSLCQVLPEFSVQCLGNPVWNVPKTSKKLWIIYFNTSDSANTVEPSVYVKACCTWCENVCFSLSEKHIHLPFLSTGDYREGSSQGF